MNSIEVWQDNVRQISEDSKLVSSFRCMDLVRSIPLYETHEYNGYLNFAKKIYQEQTDTWMPNWKLAMTNDPRGYNRCPTFFTKDSVRVYDINSSTTNIKCNHHYYTYNLNTKKDILDFDRIVELGGGCGDMAKFIRNMGFRGEYIIIDLPEILKIQDYNLHGYDVELTTSTIPYKDNTLFISTWALSECPMDWRHKVISELNPQNYLITYQQNFEGISNEEYFKDWGGIRIDIPWIHWDGGSKYLLK